MLSPDLLRQIRRLQLRAKRIVDNLLGGEYHSVFKGMGVVFEEVREYQAGDDVRAIDWNVTARMGRPFIKRFIEERELTVMLVLDCSRSLDFGSQRLTKREVAAELAAVLAFSAISNHDKVGLLAVSDRVEAYLPPRKGVRPVLRIVRDLLSYEPTHAATSLHIALDYLNRVLRRRAIVFVLSDFLDVDFEAPLKRAGRRHDCIAIRLSDPLEEELPNVGFLELEDAETGRRALVDTARTAVRAAYRQAAQRRREELRQMARGARIDLVEVSTAGGHFDALVRFFFANANAA